MSDSHFDLANIFNTEDIVPQCEATNFKDVVRLLVNRIAEHHKLEKVDALVEAVVNREEKGSTIIAPGLAVPHARLPEMTRPYAAVATSEKGMEFPKEDGQTEKVNFVFLVLVPENQPALYLQILRALSTAFGTSPDLKAVSIMTNAGDIKRFFDSGKVHMPRFITASDVMNTDYIALKDTDTLQKCVDTFIKNNISEIPVVDRDGDMVGIVRAGELLRVCLPEYLLWMNDLSPIANFEPFVEVLQNESKTLLSEIVQKEEFPFVAPDAPAISVAGEMTRSKSSRCYVRDGNKLVGLIHLPRFLNKLFRE